VRVVDKVVYAKAPVAELAPKFGGTAADIASARKEATASSPTFGALFDGSWVSLDVKKASDLPAAAFGLPTDQAGSAKTLAEVKTSASNLFKGATITRDAADPKHLVVTSSTVKAYAEVKRLVTAISGTSAKDLTDEFDKAPKDRPIVIDLWIDNQKLTALELNLLQFIDGATGRVALRLDMTTGQPITAPEGATKIDPKALTDKAGATGGGSPAAVDMGATEVAEMLGYAASGQAQQGNGKPADYLKAAVAQMPASIGKARIVKHGVAEVTAHGAKACLRLPASYTKEPSVKKGAC
jgi:hypothetical protein